MEEPSRLGQVHDVIHQDCQWQIALSFDDLPKPSMSPTVWVRHQRKTSAKRGSSTWSLFRQPLFACPRTRSYSKAGQYHSRADSPHSPPSGSVERFLRSHYLLHCSSGPWMHTTSG